MNFMLALNVTIYGLGIVFLALLVLMVAIMLLSKAFSMATGKDLLAVPTPSAPCGGPAAGHGYRGPRRGGPGGKRGSRARHRPAAREGPVGGGEGGQPGAAR